MSKEDFDEMTLLDEPLRERADWEISVVEAFEPGATGQSTTVPAAAQEASGDAAEAGDAKSLVVTATPPKEASFSRGLVDTYFRQMGDAPWLTREEETELAKRIETAQAAMVTALCTVP